VSPPQGQTLVVHHICPSLQDEKRQVLTLVAPDLWYANGRVARQPIEPRAKSTRLHVGAPVRTIAIRQLLDACDDNGSQLVPKTPA